MTSQPTFSRVPCYLAEIRLWFLNGFLEWAAGHEPFFKSSTFYGILGGKDSIISSNWLALPSPKLTTRSWKNDDLGDYLGGKPETRRGGYWKGFASPWSFERNLRRQENYTKMLQEKDLLLESQDLLWEVLPWKRTAVPWKSRRLVQMYSLLKCRPFFRGHSLVFGGVCGYHDHTLVYLSYSCCSRSSPPIWPQTNKTYCVGTCIYAKHWLLIGSPHINHHKLRL